MATANQHHTHHQNQDDDNYAKDFHPTWRAGV
jgi:hypothetical protein